MSSNLSERQKLRYVENSAGESREESLVRHHLFYYWLREEPFHFVLRLAGARFIWWATDWPSSVATQREADAFTEPFIVAQTAPHQVAPVTSEPTALYVPRGLLLSPRIQDSTFVHKGLHLPLCCLVISGIHRGRP